MSQGTGQEMDPGGQDVQDLLPGTGQSTHVDAEALLAAARQVVARGLAPEPPGAAPAVPHPVDEELVRLEVEQLDEELRVVEQELARRRQEGERLLAQRSRVDEVLTRVLASLPVAAVTTDVAGAVHQANAEAGALLRVHEISLQRKPLFAYVHPADRRAARAALSQVLRTQRRVELDVRLVPRAATAPVPAHVVVVPLPDLDGARTAAQWVLEPVAAARPATTMNALVDLARLQRRTGSLRDLLGDLARLVASAVPGAAYASVLVGPAEDPRVLVTTGLPAQQVEGAQFRTGEGPGRDCLRSGAPVLAEPHDPRWPRLALPEDATGPLLALPLFADGDDPVGVLTVFARPDVAPGWPGDDARLTAQVFADAAGNVVRESDEVDNLRALVRQLSEALSSRAVIEQAKGMIMATERVDADHAFALLSRLSQDGNVKLRVLAQQVVEHVGEAGPARRQAPAAPPVRRHRARRG